MQGGLAQIALINYILISLLNVIPLLLTIILNGNNWLLYLEVPYLILCLHFNYLIVGTIFSSGFKDKLLDSWKDVAIGMFCNLIGICIIHGTIPTHPISSPLIWMYLQCVFNMVLIIIITKN
jgi:hypothetical protein